MKKPHVHAELIKAWADGAEIEIYDDGTWKKAWNLNWYEACVYRIKPEPKPDVSFRLIVRKVDAYPEIHYPEHWEQPNIKFTFDGKTGKLKKAEVLE